MQLLLRVRCSRGLLAQPRRLSDAPFHPWKTDIVPTVSGRQTVFSETHLTLDIFTFIQSDLQYIQVIQFFCQYVCSLGIEPTTFVLLTQSSTTEPQEHTHFKLLPSGRCYRLMKTRTNRLKKIFYPRAITALNTTKI